MKSNHILKQWQVMISAVFFLLAYPSSGQGNLIINGNFDLGSYPTNVPGWTLTNSYWIDGIIWLSPITSAPSVSQTVFGLDAGVTYLISGDYQQGKGISTNCFFDASVDGIVLFETSADTMDHDWHSFSFLYTASSASITLSLSAILKTDMQVGYGIDNIALYAVPEPSVISLAVLAGGALFYVRKRNPMGNR